MAPATRSVAAGNQPVRTIAATCMETVADVMMRHPKLCHENSTVGDVRRLFADDHVHAVLIVSAALCVCLLVRQAPIVV